MTFTSIRVPRRAVLYLEIIILAALFSHANPGLAADRASGSDEQSIRPKFPLSWRVTAYSMSGPTSLTSARAKATCTLSISYNEVGKYLSPALNQLGLTLVSAYPQSGQYLAVPSGLTADEQLKGQLIIVAQPIGESQTLMQTKVIGDGRLFDLKKVDDIPALMSTMVQRKGLM